jgi:hypothetical protein
MNILQIKWIEAKKARREFGNLTLFKCSLLFLIKPIYQGDSYYLYECHINECQVKKDFYTDQRTLQAKPNHFMFKVVSSNQEADQLEMQGYEFRSHPTDFNLNLKRYRQRLDSGLIALCTFVDKEFAAIVWIVPSQAVQDRIRNLPVKVDYSNHEVIPRGTWVNPKYRNFQTIRASFCNLKLFLQEKNITMMKSPMNCTNKTGLRLVEALGFKRYGNARLLRVLFWRFWSENNEQD